MQRDETKLNERYRTGWSATCCQWGRRNVTDSGLARHVACSGQATNNGSEIGYEIGLWLSYPPSNHRRSCKGISMGESESEPRERLRRQSRESAEESNMQREHHAESNMQREQHAERVTCTKSACLCVCSGFNSIQLIENCFIEIEIFNNWTTTLFQSLECTPSLI